jgi:hypothetical protein
MAATFEWSESNSSGENITDGITNVNLGSNDSVNIVPATYPVTAGENSFSKYIRCKFTNIFVEISNMLFWKNSGSLATGETIKASANATYATPSTTATGDSAIPTTEGTALTINSAEGESTIVYGGSGVSGYTGYIRLQLQLTTAVVAGALTQKQFTFQFDEV